MNDHFTITINDDHGVRQFNLHQIVKKGIWYAALFLGFVTLIAVGTILYLNYSVDQIEIKRENTQIAYDSIKKKNAELDQSMRDTQMALMAKKKELNEVSDSLSEIETLIGISPVEDMSLQDRVSITKVNSEHMATLLQFIPSGSPIEYKGVTSNFGYRIHPTLDRKEFHRGLDMKAPMKTPVYATADGIVEYAGIHKSSGFGKLVILQHNYGFRSYFGHLNSIVIKSGKFVKKGALIAYTGNSGMSSGPHLHYELRFIQRAVNPFYFVKWNVQNYKDIFEKEKQIPWQSLITATAHIKVPNPTQTLPSSQLALRSKVK
ncbi:peptidase M23B [Sulfurimonas gotlandica GD1]|uniref:Peptidase M23B n=1 Tax=Sulfurimonas gotlandica (strain DSM 19862 / JCM 16533 / GD1) TaxID=929558 RepID=B6BKV4_SULGG|nr:M23 family metallopeptidase [Sulfurimonas gotlandica]EDZ62278.1 peptidase M23B [Sulfurimonas gotlandica GD1]EHP29165.1 peptidase M23B [Sulfurimonas gotlandica GD1]